MYIVLNIVSHNKQIFKMNLTFYLHNVLHIMQVTLACLLIILLPSMNKCVSHGYIHMIRSVWLSLDTQESQTGETTGEVSWLSLTHKPFLDTRFGMGLSIWPALDTRAGGMIAFRLFDNIIKYQWRDLWVEVTHRLSLALIGVALITLCLVHISVTWQVYNSDEQNCCYHHR